MSMPLSAAAAAAVLPAAELLIPGTPQPGSDQVAATFAGAVVADLEGPLSGRVAVLVGDELVAALAASPLGGLDLASALQPTLDAVAAALHARAGAGREAGLGLVAADLGGAFTTVHLLGTRSTAAVLVTDHSLRAARHAPSLAGGAEPSLVGSVGADPVAVPAAGVPSGLPSVTHVAGGQRRGIELLHGVDMEVTVEIGRTRMTVRELLDLSPGAVLELDRAAGSPADLLVNGRLIARGEVVVIDEDFGLRVTEIVTDAAVG